MDKAIIYKDSFRGIVQLFAGRVESEGKKQYVIKPLTSGHFNGYRSRIPKDQVIIEFEITEDNSKYLNILIDAQKLHKDYVDEERKLDNAYKQQIDLLINKAVNEKTS